MEIGGVRPPHRCLRGRTGTSGSRIALPMPAYGC